MARYLAFLAVALSTLCSVQAAQADTYNFQDLGTYGTDYMRSSNGNAINDNNQVACDSYYAIPFVVATLWQGGAMMLLPSFTDPTGYGAAYTSGINNAGQIAGTGYEAVDDFYYPFIYSNGVTTSISLPGWGGDASTGGINNNGQMVATTGVLGQAEIATTAGVTHLPLLNGIGSTQGYGINNANPVEVVGMAEPVALGSQHAVLWKNGVIYDLGSLGGPNTVAYAINDNGWVVGSADVPAVGNNAAATHAFVWIPNTPNGTTGVMHDIGVLNGGTSTTATAINNNNTVVGWGIFGIDSTSGFVWDQANGLRDLAPLIVNTNTNVPGSIANFIERVSGINSNGQICGTETWYVNDQSIEHGFVLTPTGGVAPLAPNNLQAAVPQAGAHPAAVVHPPLIATTVAPNTVNLSWNANSINETGFLIQRQTAGSGTWVNLITTSAFVQSYTDNSVQPNTSYYYVVYAINTIGSSGPSNVVLATTGPSSITVTSLAFSPASVTAGTASTATVTLSAAAPTGGEDVTITDSGTYIATVQVPAGQTTGAYTQQTSPMIDGPNTLTAQFNGTSANGTLTVTSDPTLPVPVSIAYTPNPVAVGGTTTGKVTLSAVAPTGGAPVYIFINNGYVALFTVPAGQTSITYTDTVQVAGTFTHAASYNGVQVTTNLVVGSTTAAPTITSLSPISATAGGAAFTLTVNGAGFVSGAVVKWNGVALTTTFASSLQVTAAVPAADIATAGTASVTLTNPNAQVSNTVTLTIKNPAPSLTTISPSLATSGGAAFTLTVNGAHFLTGAVVKWNSVALTTTFVSASQVTAAVPATDIASPGTASVTVTNTDAQVSNVLTFTISPSPTITSLSPTSATAGGAAFTLTVNGAGFVSGAVVKWNGVALTTTFVSSLQVTAAVPATDIATAGTASVTLTNPNSQVSKTVSLTIKNPAPSLTTLSPALAAPGGAAFTLTVNGAHFLTGAVVKWNGVALTTTFVSASQVSAAVPATDIASAGTASVTVTNTDAQVSNALTLTISSQPTITSLSPTSATAGGAAFTLTVNGAGFVSGAVVKWNGVALTTTFVSSLQVTAAVPATDIATAGTASVTLTNPNAQVSNSASLTIKNPAPSLTTISPALAVPGGAAFTLTVSGAHFLTGAVVKWNSVSLTTTFVSSSQVTAAVPATDIASAGTASVTVTNTDAQVSNVLTFTISPSPTITSLSPTSATAGGAAFTLTVNGAGFVSGAVVKWNGVALTTTFVSSLQVTAAVPAADIATAGTASVTLTNPNSQVSGSQSFVVQAVVVPKSLVFNPNPAFSCGETLGTISLTGNAPTGGAAVALTLNGTSLGTVTVPAGQSGATVLLSLSTVTTATNITMAIAYNGGSASTTLTVNPTAVKILSLVYKPNPVIGGSSATGTVTLSAAAPAGGAVITLTGAVSYSFVVPAGQTSAGYTQPTGVVTTSTTYTFHATYNGATVNGTLTANP